ncbi:G-PROTEIN-RECEP-F1-2 domain-containing protein [Aphelenchoides fujianensis]|nr:G-PROTEIN-RECEP-F1-2 domain-containing protein [Aphelenchoides fujianensis]KAI6241961.1 G-PROTEIN-RECEP-F1-2 domain-containing protein [Aphelenchoides fujianensis]
MSSTSVEQCQLSLIPLPNESVVYDRLHDFHEKYKPIHTYLSIVFCALGAVLNSANIIVLTRKQMRNSPVNAILTAMAFADTVVLFSNLIYTTHYSFVAFANCLPRHWSYVWAMFLVAHAHLSLIGHTTSLLLSVMLAFLRYLTLRNRGGSGNIQVGMKHAYIAIASVIVFVVLMNLPNFATYKIIEVPLPSVCEEMDPAYMDALAYFPDVSDLATETFLHVDCLIFRMAFWITGIMFKMIPCLLLSLFIWLLTRILKQVKQNRQKLLGSTRNGNHLVQPNPNGAAANGLLEPRKDSRNVVSASPQPRTNSMRRRGAGRSDRTTHMLLAIVLVFLFTELPQGIMSLLNGFLPMVFRVKVYNKVGDVIDLLSLCNSCMSFIIYTSMSSQFRAEFRRVFIPAQVNCWLSPHQAARRCSDAFFSKNPTTHTQFLNTETVNNNHSVTIASFGSRPSVRRLSTGESAEDSPRRSTTPHVSADFHRRSTQALLSEKDDQSLELHSTSHLGDCSPLLRVHTPRHADSSVSSTGSVSPAARSNGSPNV